MKFSFQKIYALFTVLILLNLTSCNNAKESADDNKQADIHNSENSLDWAGTYRGITPCADCPGIKMELVLDSNLTYTSYRQYLERTDSVYEEHGNFSWKENGNEIVLQKEGDSQPQYVKVGENEVILLDGDAKIIEGEIGKAYHLNKASADVEIENKFWLLKELGGKEISNQLHVKNLPHFVLQKEGHKIYGSTACNYFNGEYTLEEGNKISFTPLAVTKKACFEIDYEIPFLKAINDAKSYKINGDDLTLFDANNKAIAGFEYKFFKGINNK